MLSLPAECVISPASITCCFFFKYTQLHFPSSYLSIPTHQCDWRRIAKISSCFCVLAPRDRTPNVLFCWKKAVSDERFSLPVQWCSCSCTPRFLFVLNWNTVRELLTRFVVILWPWKQNSRCHGWLLQGLYWYEQQSLASIWKKGCSSICARYVKWIISIQDFTTCEYQPALFVQQFMDTEHVPCRDDDDAVNQTLAEIQVKWTHLQISSHICWLHVAWFFQGPYRGPSGLYSWPTAVTPICSTISSYVKYSDHTHNFF